MDWSSFLGALVGTAVGVLAVFGIMALWFYISDRLAARKQVQKPPPTLESILESHLEQYVVKNFTRLFPGWKIFDEPLKGADGSGVERKPVGVRYRTGAGEIDILAVDPQDALVVIELKRSRASDSVTSQVDRYIAWVRKYLAKPGQKVRGLIIAQSVGSSLAYTLSRRRGITVWTYEWQLRFDKRARRSITVNLDRRSADESSSTPDTQ